MSKESIILPMKMTVPGQKEKLQFSDAEYYEDIKRILYEEGVEKITWPILKPEYRKIVQKLL